ncbi:MAG TPA: DNA integrity scanning diadenylate cyclase DisA [Bacillota bacterium]|nr:DNA integrity scanning diadenylate cyclase DisA [Bacillota bacterium]
MRDEVSREGGLQGCLRMIAPGTPLREGLENVLKAKTGGIIVIGDSKEVMSLVDGGFYINSDFLPAYLYELAKMDGAIILSRDLRKILYANTQLIPDPSIPSSETGIRHRTAERVARQTGELVISISQRRNVITIYKGYLKYVLKDLNIILSKANQALQTLTKYKSVLDRTLANLGVLEFDDAATVMDVALAVQKAEIVARIVTEVDRYIHELGIEGKLVSMQLDELVAGLMEEEILLVMDYLPQEELNNCKEVIRTLRNQSSEDLLELTFVAKILGLGNNISTLDLPVSARGFRILSKIPRLPINIIENLISEFDRLQRVLKASIEELDNVEGIGEVRARIIKESLKRIYEQIQTERHI